MSLQTILSAISSFIWGPPLLILLSGTGLYLTLRLGFLQIRYLPRALGYLFARGANKGKGDVSSLRHFVRHWPQPSGPGISSA